MGSVCSLNETLRRPWSTRTDVAGHAAADVAYIAEGQRRVVAYRHAHPEIDARICDVAFAEFMRDPAATLARISTHLGLGIGPEALAAMLDYLSNRPREKYGKHSYALDQFSLFAPSAGAAVRGI